MRTTTSAGEGKAQTRPVQQERGYLFFAKRSFLVLVILLVVLPLLRFTYETITAAGDAQRYPRPGQLVTVDGYAMQLHCGGEGRLTVILASGVGGLSMMWPQSLITVLSEETRVCANSAKSLKATSRRVSLPPGGSGMVKKGYSPPC